MPIVKKLNSIGILVQFFLPTNKAAYLVCDFLKTLSQIDFTLLVSVTDSIKKENLYFCHSIPINKIS